MTFKIKCVCRFDLTPTGIKNNFSKGRIPFLDGAGVLVNSMAVWHRSRNQQRNWETVNQIISLRVLPEEIELPTKVTENDQTWWQFYFTITQPAALELGNDPVGYLYADAKDVPMLTNLDEDAGINSFLSPKINIIFEPIYNK